MAWDEITEESRRLKERKVGFAGDVPKQLVWREGGDSVVYAAGPSLVEMGALEGYREGACLGHLGGHTARVCALAAFPGGRLLVSSQEGPAPHLRLWDLETASCLAILDGERPQASAVTGGGGPY
jgi:hypothetical protein